MPDTTLSTSIEPSQVPTIAPIVDTVSEQLPTTESSPNPEEPAAEQTLTPNELPPEGVPLEAPLEEEIEEELIIEDFTIDGICGVY